MQIYNDLLDLNYRDIWEFSSVSYSDRTKNPGLRKSVDFDGFSKKTELIAIYVREKRL